MEVLYINLARRTERNERFLTVNGTAADFLRLEAVDGQQLRVDELVRDGVLQEPLKAYTPGALGCALSHKQVWERSIATGKPVTVAEDDAVFNRHFAAKADTVFARLPDDWDIVLWGWNFTAWLHVEVIEGLVKTFMRWDKRRLGQQVSEFREKDYDVLPLRLMEAWGTVCYTVSPKGAQRLMDSCFPLRKERIWIRSLRCYLSNAGIDAAMNRHYSDLKAYASFPPLVWTENDKSASDIHPRGGWLYRLWKHGLP